MVHPPVSHFQPDEVAPRSSRRYTIDLPIYPSPVDTLRLDHEYINLLDSWVILVALCYMGTNNSMYNVVIHKLPWLRITSYSRIYTYVRRSIDQKFPGKALPCNHGFTSENNP
jgi:hypothetical protein